MQWSSAAFCNTAKAASCSGLGGEGEHTLWDKEEEDSRYLILLELGVTFPASHECLASHPSSSHWEWLQRKVQGSSIGKERWVKHPSHSSREHAGWDTYQPHRNAVHAPSSPLWMQQR